MTYRNSLQGRFVATGYPAAGMAFVSLFLWALGALFVSGGGGLLAGLFGLGSVASRLVSLFFYGITALVLGRLYLFERRVQWLPALYLWLPAVFMLVQPSVAMAVSSLLLVLSVSQLFLCVAGKGVARALFGAFALLSLSSLFLVQFALLLPLFVAYMVLSRNATPRLFLAALLGVLAPCWLLFGAIYAFPVAAALLLPAKESLAHLLAFPGCQIPLVGYVWVAVELLVWVVAVCVYASSSYPAKPLLRRRLLFIILLNACLLLLSVALPHEFLLFLVWRMPGMAIMTSYLFSMKITRLSNIFFISLNAVWLLIAFMCLWTG